LNKTKRKNDMIKIMTILKTVKFGNVFDYFVFLNSRFAAYPFSIM
jgi:hypothetical protein